MGSPKKDGLSAYDYRKLVEWFIDDNRNPATTAFTAGAAKDAATAYEQVLAMKEGR